MFSFPKDIILAKIRELDFGVICKLREQLYELFVGSFEDDIFSQYGFTPEKPIEQLKERRKPIQASVDIHNLGYSICENQIIGKTVSDIIKPSAIRNPATHQRQQHQQSSQTIVNPGGIIDQNNQVIVEKLNELITLNKSVLNENKTLKDSIVTLESILEKSIASNNRLINEYLKMSAIGLHWSLTCCNLPEKIFKEVSGIPDFFPPKKLILCWKSRNFNCLCIGNPKISKQKKITSEFSRCPPLFKWKSPMHLAFFWTITKKYHC